MRTKPTMNAHHVSSPRSVGTFASLTVAALLVAAHPAHSATLSITNGSFETGSIGDGSVSPGIAGWTDAGASDGFWLADDNVPGSTPDPTEASDGTTFLYANRLSGGAGSQPSSSTLSQVVSLDAPNLALVQSGGATISLDFDYFDSDQNDPATVTLTFLDNTLAELGSITTGVLPEYANGTVYDATTAPWMSANLPGAVDSSTTAVRIDIITGPRIGGSATNLSFDNFSAQIIPEPSVALLGLIGFAGLLRRKR